MKLAINEIKRQAKKLQRSIRSGETLSAEIAMQLKSSQIDISEIKLKHCLSVISKQLGFIHWHQAHQFFSGKENSSNKVNWGTYLYPERGDVFINEWFSNYRQAKLVLDKASASKWLLPYKQQFIVVSQDYIDNFNLTENTAKLWQIIHYDMKTSYNTDVWDQLTAAIIQQQFSIKN